MTLLLAHVFGLIFVMGMLAFRAYSHPLDRVLAVTVTAWANIVVTGLALSAMHKLGDPLLFVRTSMFLALVMLVSGYLVLRPEPNALPTQRAISREVNWLPILAFALTIAPLVVANVAIAMAYPPNNYDSLTYHLPRVMFYLGQGSLAHFETPNSRQIFFPFNLTLLHLAILQHGIAFEKLLTLLNVGFWIIAGIAIYRICRIASSSVGASLAATWLALTATEVLAQATATTNDLPTGAALLAGAVFVQQWMLKHRSRDALMAGMALGLAFGSKLTAVFFLPPAALISMLLAYRYRSAISRQLCLQQMRIWFAPLVAFAILAAPFAVYNMEATGHWMTHEFDFTLNKPFDLGVFWQTAKTYSLQFLLEPFQRFTFDLSITTDLNHLAETILFSDWNPAYAFSPLYFFPPDLNEDHVWFGFAGGFVAFVALVLTLRELKHMTAIGSLACLGLGWFLFYFALNKWSLYIQRYFTLPFLFMAPCASYYFDKTYSWRTPRSVSRLSIIAMFITAYWFSLSYLTQNTARPLAPLIFKSIPKPPVLPTPPELLAALSNQVRINMALTGTNERIFPIMRNSGAQAFTSSSDIKPDQFNLISKWAFTKDAVYHNIAAIQSYMTLPLPSKRTAGIEVLGTTDEGVNEHAYFGLAPHSARIKASAQNGNILVSFKYKSAAPDRFTNSRLRLIGLNPEDGLEAKIFAEYQGDHKQLLASVRDSSEAILSIPNPPTRLLIELHDVAGDFMLAAGELPFRSREANADTQCSGVLTPTCANLNARQKVADDPNLIFGFDFIGKGPESNSYVSGLAPLEGPYAQWSLPSFRWAKQRSVRIAIPAHSDLKRIFLNFSARLQVRDTAELELLHNNRRVKLYHLSGKTSWLDDSVDLAAAQGENIIELRDTLAVVRPDWDAYLAKNPEAQRWVAAQGLTPEQGAEQHFERIGRKEGKSLPFKSLADIKNTPPESLFFAFRALQLVGRKDIP